MDQSQKVDLIAAEDSLQQLIAEVAVQEGHLGPATGPGQAERCLRHFDATRIAFGPPQSRFVRLKPALFKSLGIELDPIQKAQLASWNFYYILLTLTLIPGDAVVYKQVKCDLTFTTEDPNCPAIIQTLFPDNKWVEVLNWGAGLNIGLDAGLDWEIALDSDALTPVQIKQLGDLPAGIKARVKNKNEYNGFIAIPGFRYTLGKADIVAAGQENTFGYWNITKPDLQKETMAQFGMVFKVPKNIKKVSLRALATAQPEFNWLFSNFRAVISALTQDKRDLVKDGLVKGAEVTWDLTLPA